MTFPRDNAYVKQKLVLVQSLQPPKSPKALNSQCRTFSFFWAEISHANAERAGHLPLAALALHGQASLSLSNRWESGPAEQWIEHPLLAGFSGSASGMYRKNMKLFQASRPWMSFVSRFNEQSSKDTAVRPVVQTLRVTDKTLKEKMPHTNTSLKTSWNLKTTVVVHNQSLVTCCEMCAKSRHAPELGTSLAEAEEA